MLKENTQAPDFTLPDQYGGTHTLSQYQGIWVLLYFYPKDDTPGCTKEACTIKDHIHTFQEQGMVVLGVSVDSVASHQKFSEKYSLPFILLSDEHKEVVKLYDVWGEKKMMGKTFQGTKRISYLINPQGMIVKVYPNVKPEMHATQVLQDKKTYDV